MGARTFTSRPFWSGPLPSLAVVVLLAVVPYANTFSVPFLFDDLHAIVNNASIKDLSGLWPPSGARWFGYLTFALNYAAGGLDPAGYHAVNLAVHAMAAVVLYWLVTLTFRTPFFRHVEDDGAAAVRGRVIALLAAVLFAAHPVQTQAVTYIVQRFASLAAMLYLLTVALYARARLEMRRPPAEQGRTGTRRATAWYALSLLSLVLAMKTKEIAFTLPFAVLLYEFCFFPADDRKGRRVLLLLLPYLLGLLIIPLSLGDGGGGETAVRATTEISRSDYLLTQFPVIVLYLRLLFWPTGQMLDHGHPVAHTLLDPAVLLALFLLLALLAVGCLLLYRTGRPGSDPMQRLIGFGILWFFLALSVESSIIPIADVMFEHRLYLPSAGAFAAIAATVVLFGSRLLRRSPYAFGMLLAAVIAAGIALPAATYARNEVWRSEVDLWEDVISKNPRNARAQAVMGLKFLQQGGIDEAMRRFRLAIRIKPDYAEAYVALGNAYLTKGMLDEAFPVYMQALRLGKLDQQDTAQLTMNIGTYYLRKQQPDQAIGYYRTALGLMPADAMIHHNLGLAYEMKGMRQEAAAARRKAHQLNPERY